MQKIDTYYKKYQDSIKDAIKSKFEGAAPLLNRRGMSQQLIQRPPVEPRFTQALSRQVSVMNKEIYHQMSLKESFEADQRKKFSGDGVTMDKQIVEDYIKSLG